MDAWNGKGPIFSGCYRQNFYRIGVDVLTVVQAIGLTALLCSALGLIFCVALAVSVIFGGIDF